MNVDQIRAEIDSEFKTRYQSLKAELGHEPTFSEQLELSDWAKDQYVTRVINPRATVAQHEARDNYRESKGAGETRCRCCGDGIPPTKQRGRPKQWCDKVDCQTHRTNWYKQAKKGKS